MERLSPSALRVLVEPFDLALVVLFGSRATGAARSDSDIDFGVLSSAGRRLSHRELAALHVALSRWSGLHADVVDLAAADAVFRYEILSSAKPLVECPHGTWSDFVARALIDHDDVAPFVDACVAAVLRAALTARPAR
jgi:predicted nucleotidyltransferase